VSRREPFLDIASVVRTVPMSVTLRIWLTCGGWDGCQRRESPRLSYVSSRATGKGSQACGPATRTKWTLCWPS
jgi:hypothetical protein